MDQIRKNKGNTMKYFKQFCVILLVSFIGEALKWVLPFPVPGSIYGMVLLFVLLCLGVIKLEQVQDVAVFLIEIMPILFVSAGVRLMDSWDVLQPILLPVVAIMLVTTVIVMVVAGYGTQFVIRQKQKKETGRRGRPYMNEILENSLFFGGILTLCAYEVGVIIKKKWKWAIFNPLLIAIVLIVIVLKVGHIEYRVYQTGANYIDYLLTPATVALAVPLYQQVQTLKKNAGAIFTGIVAGSFAGMASVLGLSVAFGLTHEQYVTLLPKSITTAIGMGVSEELGGIVAITVAVIALTGIFGNIVADFVLRKAHITDPVAKGIAIGTSSHAMGTAKALEMGEKEGAMSGLSIAVAGVITVFGANLFALFY